MNKKELVEKVLDILENIYLPQSIEECNIKDGELEIIHKDCGCYSLKTTSIDGEVNKIEINEQAACSLAKFIILNSYDY